MTIETTSCAGTDTEVNYLEHVQAVITLNATRRGDVELFLRYLFVLGFVLNIAIKKSNLGYFL